MTLCHRWMNQNDCELMQPQRFPNFQEENFLEVSVILAVPFLAHPLLKMALIILCLRIDIEENIVSLILI